jgi:hypothetical protein
MDHRQPEHEKYPAHNVVAEVVTDIARVPLDRVSDRVAERRDRQRHCGAEQHARYRHGDASPGSSAGRTAVHDR